MARTCTGPCETRPTSRTHQKHENPKFLAETATVGMGSGDGVGGGLTNSPVSEPGSKQPPASGIS